MFQPVLQRRFSARCFFLLVNLLLILALAGCGGFGSTTDTSSTSNAGGAGNSSNATVTTGSSNATPTTSASSQPTSTSHPATFQVTGISVSVDHPTFTGICGNTMSRIFTAVIHVPANTHGGTVTYHWAANGGGVFQTQTISFAAGQTSRTVTETAVTGASWGNGTQLWLALHVTAPNTFTSAHDAYSFVCQRKIKSITASVTPTNACPLANKTFAFKATIVVSPGPGSVTVTYHWKRSDGGTGQTSTVTVPNGQTSITVTNSWSLFSPIPTGSYWEEVIASSPNGITSNHASFSVITC